jgi:hypothetical protein
MKVRMKSRSIFRTCSEGLLLLSLLIQPLSVGANICVDKRLKPLKHFCGVVVDSQGSPISNVTISVTRAGTEVGTSKSDARGEFSFDELGAGQYDFTAEAKNFAKFGFSFTIAKPNAKCKQKVQLQLAVGLECSHVRLIGR